MVKNSNKTIHWKSRLDRFMFFTHDGNGSCDLYRVTFWKCIIYIHISIYDPGMHRGTCVTRAVMHVGNANPQWRGKRSGHSQRMRNPLLYVSGKRSIGVQFTIIQHWPSWWLDPAWMTIRYLNLCWPKSLTHTRVTKLCFLSMHEHRLGQREKKWYMERLFSLAKSLLSDIWKKSQT